MDILALTPYPNISADTRYRISQFVPYLEPAGWHLTLRPFMDDAFFAMYNRPGKTPEKSLRALRSLGSRLADLAGTGRFDLLWLHKEAFPFGPPVMEYLFKKRLPALVYDMDDAFWTHPPQFRQIGSRLRDPDRISKMIRLSSHVLAGNDFLADYARQYNPSVSVFPTVVDTSRYSLRQEEPDGCVTIGWVGRWSSSPYLGDLVPVFRRLCASNPAIRITFIGAGDLKSFAGLPIQIKPWTLKDEVENIAAFDIGIMPLPDDEYSRGKCGFKLLQYMALGIPAVASPVGVNRTIISDGINGFLANSADEWYEKILLLAADVNERKRIGLTARETVVEKYSLEKSAPRLIETFTSLIKAIN